jgi:rhodanese-related sulfurtransferase
MTNPRSRPARHARTIVSRFATAAAVVLALVLGGCGSGSQATVHATPGATPSAAVAGLPAQVPVAVALAMRDAGAFMLDVREPDEWAAGHIPGATLIPLGELAGRISEVPTDRDVVVVCHSGNRSAQGRDMLLGAGLARVTSMTGGMTQWTAAGIPIETGP